MSQSDPSKNGRHSLFERIAFTFGLDPIDRNILLALATFGNYKTGAGCKPSLATLAERCHVSKRTARRSTAQLVKGGYIIGTPRHLKPTIYDICLPKLAVDMRGTVLGAKSGPQDDPLAAKSGPQDDPEEESLGANYGPQDPPLAAKSGRQDPSLAAKLCTSLGAKSGPRSSSTYGSSSTYDPPIRTDPPKVPRGSAPTPPTNPETTTAPPRSVWAGIGQVRRTGADHTVHQGRTALVAKVLRTVIPHRATWPDHHTVKVALRAELKRLRILEDLDYGQAHFDDAIAIVNTATPFIGRGVIH